MNRRRIVLFVGFILAGAFLHAQESELRTLLLGKIKLGSRLTTAFDGGHYKGFGGADYSRWGIRNLTAYKLSDVVSVDVGFMYNRTAKPGQVIKNEFRPHQSVKITFPQLNSLVFTHRFRMEEQFLTYSYKENDITSRFRYEIKTKRAFSLKKEVEPKTAYWMVSVEFFFNPVGNIEHDHVLFKRGRHGVGLGYKINSKTTIEGALLYQHTHGNTNFKDRSEVTIFNFYIKNSLFSRK